MDPERRRSLRVRVADDGTNALVRGALAVGVRDISSGGLGLDLGSALDPGAICPLTALLRGLSLATPVRITRCEAAQKRGDDGDGATWDVGAEFLWRDEADATALRKWLARRGEGTS